MLTEVKLIAGCKRVHLTALEGRSASSTKTSSATLIQNFTKECDDKFIMGVVGTEESGGKTVRGPRVGFPKEVHRIVELRE